MKQQVVTQPLREASFGGVLMTALSDSLASEIEQVLMTRGFNEGSIGELPWDCDFGSGLDYLRHMKESDADTMKELVRFYCLESLQKYLPEVSVIGVSVGTKEDNSGGKALIIDIQWQENSGSKSLILSL